MDRLLALLIKLFIFLSGFAKPLSRIGIGTYEEWAPGKKLKLLMVGYNGARNTGADARVVAAVRQIKELFGAENVHISVLTLSVESLDGYFDLRGIHPQEYVCECVEPLFLRGVRHHGEAGQALYCLWIRGRIHGGKPAPVRGESL